MNQSQHEIVLDLEPAVAADDGRRYRPSVVARFGADGHCSAWLEFVDPESQQVLRTGIETQQASEADLHHWARSLSDVYLRGALDRAVLSQSETVAHRRAVKQANVTDGRAPTGSLDPFKLFALGEHVLRRELLLFKRATLHALITDYALNPAGLDLSRFTRAQLVAFIGTAIEVQRGRSQP